MVCLNFLFIVHDLELSHFVRKLAEFLVSRVLRVPQSILVAYLDLLTPGLPGMGLGFGVQGSHDPLLPPETHSY